MTGAKASQSTHEEGKNTNIPDYLIYEMDEGKPIYYRGYKDVLNKTKTAEQIIGSSALHSLLVYLIQTFLFENLGKDFLFLTGELGYQWAPKTWRNIDLAIYDRRKFKDKTVFLSNKHIDIAPEIVIEVDTKADLTTEQYPDSYFHRKTDQLLDNGVEKVIWLFTHSRKFLVAEKGKNWIMNNWSENFEIKTGIEINIEELLKEF